MTTREFIYKERLTDGSTIVHLAGTVWRVFDAGGRRFRDFPTLELAKASTVPAHHERVHTINCDLDDDCDCS